MRLKYLFFIISIIIIGCKNNGNINKSNLNYGSFYYSQRWNGVSGNNEIVMTGELIKNVIIYNINDNKKVKINIKISMTGSGVLMGETIAEKVNDKYEFNFIDNWDNNAFGNIIFNNDGTITFYLDCNEFSDFGKTRVGRLYGSTDILQKGVIEFN
jgi:hypothetical protein